MSLYDILLGQNSPVAKWGNSNSNTLLGLGTALLSGPRLDLSSVQQGRMADIAVADKQKQEAQQAQQANATRQLFERDAPDLAQLLDTGVPMGEVWGEYMRRKQPAPAPNLPNEYELFQLAQKDPAFAEYLQSQKSTGSLPTSYQEFQLAQKDPAYAAQLSSSTSKPPTDAQRRAEQLYSVVKPDADLLLGDGSANKGVFDALANGLDQTLGASANGVAPLKAFTSADYQRATNAVTNIAQSYLYAVSGQAAPAAEVEKIVRSITPIFGEDPKSVADKKARLEYYVNAIRLGQKNPDGAGNSGGTDDIESILSGLGI